MTDISTAKTFSFNEQILGKGRTVLALVNHYVNAFKDDKVKVTEDELRVIFPDELVSKSIGVFKKVKDVSKERYYFMDAPFELDGEQYVVTNQITSDNLNKILQHLQINHELKISNHAGKK